MEWRGRNEDQDWSELCLLCVPTVVDESGKRIGLISVLISRERKQAEEALRQQTERERLVVEIAQHIRQSLA